jgi:L,D-transpeptidase YcbB
MRMWQVLGASVLAYTLAYGIARAEPDAVAAVPAEDPRTQPVQIDTGAPPEVMAGTASPLATAIRQQLAEAAAGLSEREAEERAAVAAFYDARAGAPLWLSSGTLNAKADALLAEMAKAGDYGLDAADFAPPQTKPEPLAKTSAKAKPAATSAMPPEASLARVEMDLTLTALKYARYARGGRIMHPAQELSSYLDRAPQLMDPNLTLKELAATEDAGAYLRSLHPHHPQFEKLRQKYLEARGDQTASRRKTARALSADAKRLLANMEEWRWMPADMGELHVWNNIPEYLLRVSMNGEIVHTEKIVAGLIDKQTPIFSRPMRKIVFRPKWKIPESIKVREIWPSLLRGGGLMSQFGLRIETKDGQVVPTKSVNWAKEDIRNYEVIQPPGNHSILGNLKFSFPNPHTVYMHDTQDKHLFAATQRTYSHGCMRVRNPAKLAEVLLNADKGWDAAKIDELIKSGPLDNEVALERKIPVHITYFTAWVEDDGKVRTFRDVYGHERRITLALEGRWNEINKGRDHLAPVVPDMAAAVRPKVSPVRTANEKPFDFIAAVLGGGF